MADVVETVCSAVD